MSPNPEGGRHNKFYLQGGIWFAFSDSEANGGYQTLVTMSMLM